MTEDHTTHAPEAQPGTPQNDAPKTDTPQADGTQTEEFTVSANKLLGKVKELIQEGNVRKLILRSESGQSLLEIPLNAGIAGVAALAVFAPALVAVGAIAALVTSVSITVVRGPQPAEAPKDLLEG
ncbi:DUF4342 domain-containing protein [Salana multivorans]